MSSLAARIRFTSLPALALLGCSWSVPVSAEQGAWWQRIHAYATAGVAGVKADPDTGGNVTMSFSDTTAPGVATLQMVGGNGHITQSNMPHGTVGLRFNLRENLNLGAELYDSAFNDHWKGYPGLANPPSGSEFATETETGSIRLETTDLVATASYSLWHVTLEGLYGKRTGSFDAEGEIEAFGVFTTGNFVNVSMSNGSAFTGDGDVYGYGLSLKVPRTPFSLYTRYRKAELEGESDSFGRSVGTVASSPSAPLVGAATVTRDNARSSADIEDAEYGLQYDFEMTKSRYKSFVRLSYLKQKWELDGPPTGGAGFGGTIGELTTNAFAAAGLGNAELKGASLAVGVQF